MREIWQYYRLSVERLATFDYDLKQMFSRIYDFLFPNGLDIDRSLDLIDEQWRLESDYFKAPWYLIYSIFRGNRFKRFSFLREFPIEALLFLFECNKINSLLFVFLGHYLCGRRIHFEDLYKELLFRLTDFSPFRKEEYWLRSRPVENASLEFMCCLFFRVPSDLFPLFLDYFSLWDSIVENRIKSLPTCVTGKDLWYDGFSYGVNFVDGDDDAWDLSSDFFIELQTFENKTLSIRTKDHLTLVLIKGCSQAKQLTHQTILLRFVQPCVFAVYEKLQLKGFLDYAEFSYPDVLQEADGREHTECILQWIKGPYHSYSEVDREVSLVPWAPEVWNEDDWDPEFVSPVW